ncbi:MAG: hypothetical protein R6V84_09435 [Desulfobacterales bacterium]
MKPLKSRVFSAPADVLSWLGRHGKKAVAASVVIGIALPSVGAVFKPHITGVVFALLCLAFVRVDVAALKGYLHRPVTVIAATAWTSVAVPLIFGAGCRLLRLDQIASDLFLGFMLQAIASPLMAAPALAALMGLDATLVLVTLVASTAVIPLTAPFFALVFVGPALSISPTALGVKLFAILSGAALSGMVLRRFVGLAAIERHADEINGLNVIVLFVFALAIMESVGARFLADPAITLAIASLAFIVFFALLFLTAVLFLSAGKRRAFALGFMASQRNMGLMLAATGGALPELTWLYFALSQLPIYLSPQLLQPIVRKLLENDSDGDAPE